MAYVPEPTLFGAPPPGATSLQGLAFFSHFAPMGVCAGAAALAFARAAKKGAASHLAIGAGLALAAGAAFSAKCLYADFIYGETSRAAMETGLFAMAGAAALVGAGAGLIPGFRHKRGGWLRAAIPALGAVGFASAGAGQLPALAQAPGVALGVIGGVLVAAAGGLHLFDKSAPGKNPQEAAGGALGPAFVVGGLLTALGAALVRSGSVDGGVMALSFAEVSFALFTLFAVLNVVGKPSDFPRAVKAPKASVRAQPAGGLPVPPSGVGFPPPPPGGAPRPPRGGPAAGPGVMPPPPPGS